MTPQIPTDTVTLVDIIHEWLGQQGLRKIWGIQKMDYLNHTVGTIFLRENDVPYFSIWMYRVDDKGNNKYSASVYDPEFFEKLRKMLDYREQSNTIICRCSQCEGVKR